MSEWRVIMTDTESMTGIAPVCDSPDHRVWAAKSGAEHQAGLDEHVFECCPHPQIETWSETTAVTVALKLTHANAEVCS